MKSGEHVGELCSFAAVYVALGHPNGPTYAPSIAKTDVIDERERSRGVGIPYASHKHSDALPAVVDSAKLPLHSNHISWKQWAFSKGSSPSAAQGTKNPTESGKRPS